MSSSVPHSILLKKQHDLKQREIRLVKLSETRWSCSVTSIKAVKTTINAILATLEDISDESGSRAIASRGLLHQVKSFPFLLSLILFNKIFSITGNLSNLLQTEQLHYAGAASCIEATKITLYNLRSESEWQKIWDEAVTLARAHEVEVVPIRRRRRFPTYLANNVVEAHTGDSTSVDEYRTVVFYATIDTLLQDLNDRFSELNLSLLKSLQALVPNSNSFLNLSFLQPFLTHYGIDEDSISSELLTASTLLQKVSPPLTSMHHVYSHLYEVKECFPLLLETIQIAMTIGVTTATAERTFSSLKRLKTYLRSTMSQERLNHLALLHIHDFRVNSHATPPRNKPHPWLAKRSR